MNMAIVNDIVLMLLYGCLCLLFSIVVAIPLNLLLQAIGYWLADRDFERRRSNYGKKR
jgi:hypothetical protein|nr:MAG TPA: toxin [Bacteriophage sp.]